MRLDSLHRALGADGAPQRAAQAAMFAARNSWRGDRRWGDLLAAFTGYAQGGALGECEPLAQALTRLDAALPLVAAFLGHMLPALAEHPLGQLPLRHLRDGGLSALVLAREGGAMLSLIAHEPGQRALRSASFGEGERHELVLAGRAFGQRVQLGEPLTCTPHDLLPGGSCRLDSARETLLIERVALRLVSLRLVRSPARPGTTREYELAEGRLIHQASGDLDESRRELMLALLGRMGRVDSVGLMARIALDHSGAGGAGGTSAHLRWQALRECLALDTSAGFRALAAIAGEGHDPLRDAALALQAQLLERHPQLAQLLRLTAPA